MKRTKVIHARVTPEEHDQIAKAAEEAGLSITRYVLRAALGATRSE